MGRGPHAAVAKKGGYSPVDNPDGAAASPPPKPGDAHRSAVPPGVEFAGRTVESMTTPYVTCGQVEQEMVSNIERRLEEQFVCGDGSAQFDQRRLPR